MNKPPYTRAEKYQLSGWLLFTFCALLYLYDSLAHGNTLVALGSFVFLVACGVFMVPLLARWS